MLTIISLVVLGAVVGLISSFFGVGGGVIIIPGLTFLFPGFHPAVIIACSLATICVNGIINTLYFYRSGQKTEARVIFILGLAMMTGSLSGSLISVGLDPALLKKLFAILLFVVFIKTIIPSKAYENDYFNGIELTPRPLFNLIFFGLIGGFLAGFMGVGGGIIIVPMLLSLFNVPSSRVSSYSNPVMAMATFVASMSYLLLPVNSFAPMPYPQFQFGHINVLVVAVMVLAIIVIAPLGVRLTKVISPKKSKWAFALLLLMMSIRMFLS